MANPSHSVRPGLVDVHVGVDQAGQQHLVVGEVDVAAAAGGSSYAVTEVIRSPVMPTQAATSAPPTIARRARRTRSAATVGRVAVGAQQHRDVVVAVVGDREHDDDLGEEAVTYAPVSNRST